MRIYSPPTPDLSPIKLYESAYRVYGPDVKSTEVRYPDAKLILDIPKEQKFEVVTKGLMVCSGIAIGFVKNEEYGMYLSHTTPHMAEQAVDGIDNALYIAIEEGYEPIYVGSLGNARSTGDAHRKIILPKVDKLSLHFGLTPDDQVYTEPSDWYFMSNAGAFGSLKTPHCVPLALINV